jgi:hypothetical protein
MRTRSRAVGPGAVTTSALVLCLLLLASAARGYGEDLCSDRPCVQVGTFNIEWLGTPNRGPESRPWPLRSRRAVEQIAALITRDLDLEVIVLLEINTWSDRAAWLFAELARAGYEVRFEGNARQNIVIAFDRDEVQPMGPYRVLEVATRFDYGDGCRSQDLRKPIAQRLRAGAFDFYVVGVHLKSQLGGDCADRVRTDQARELIPAIERLRASEADVLIVGDFNAERNDASLAPLIHGGVEPLTAKRFLAAGSYDVSYIGGRYRSLIDHVMAFSATREHNWVPRSTAVFSPPSRPSERKRYLRHTSDHVPVWASFYADGDDD